MDSQKSNRLDVTDSMEMSTVDGALTSRRKSTAGAKMSPTDRGAIAPKRARGRLRVEAILSASTEIFAEQGYDAATMTEIASRSGTAIGSLYRFFPSKSALAEMLVEHYAAHVMTHLDGVARRCAGARDPEAGAAQLADALVTMMQTLLAERASVLALVDSQNATAASLRVRLHSAMLARLQALLVTITDVSPARALASAKVILLLLKGVSACADAPLNERLQLADDLRALIAHQVTRR
ncbi:AcrR family transcriptional regulator [Robbsia andropogonis]